jgi:hypothetical protein
MNIFQDETRRIKRSIKESLSLTTTHWTEKNKHGYLKVNQWCKKEKRTYTK